MQKDNYHMSAKEFRKQGKAMIDWIADYYEKVEQFPVMSQAKPGDIRAMLPTSAPQEGEHYQQVMSDVEKIILPGITHWQSPNFFAFFPANSSGPSVLGDLLSSGLGVQGMIWATSPACTELETHLMDWIVEMLNLPDCFLSSQSGGGVIQDTASNATLCAMLAGREQATNFQSNQAGCDGKLVVYTSTQAHSSIEKGAKIAGIGHAQVRLIAVDKNYAMRPDALLNQITDDKKAGLIPCFVSTTVGTTSSNAIDPLEEIGAICKQKNIWLHVDAAMSGTAALCPEFRFIHKGLELADSYTFNPHKWMFTNFDCNCFFVKNRKALINTLSILPEYLRNNATESGAVIDYRDWHIPLGRRFRALKLWFVIRHYGVKGLQHHVRQHIAHSQKLVEWINHHEDFEMAAPAPLNLVCFRHKAGDKFNELLLEQLNASGDLYLTHTRLADKYTLRLCIAQTYTEEHHVKLAWENILKQARLINPRSA